MTEAHTPAPTHYKQPPLDFAKRQIRLIRLLSQSDSSPLECEISIFDADAPPEYYALSYTWDDEHAPKQTLSVLGETLEIGETVHNFLQSWRRRAGGWKWLWCDQLCIDQSDDLEKGHQIPLMASIYSQCYCVVVWFGLHFSTVEELLEHRYFTRLWIIQEMLLAPQVISLCGDTEIMWSDLHIHCSRLFQEGYYGRSERIARAATTPLFLTSKFGFESNKTESFSRLLMKYGSQECRDPRDKIYGLLSLIDERHRPVVDYGKPVLEVFYDGLKILHDQHWEYMNRRLDANLDPYSDWSKSPSPTVPSARMLYTEMGLPTLPAHWRLNLDAILLALEKKQKSNLSFEWFRANLTSSPTTVEHKD